MLPGNSVVKFTQITTDQAKELLTDNVESFIGHADTANVLSTILEIPIMVNRVSLIAQQGERFIVAQFSGPRLPEGTTSLPEGAKITFWLVEVN
jgi:hypothetical protein